SDEAVGCASPGSQLGAVGCFLCCAAELERRERRSSSSENASGEAHGTLSLTGSCSEPLGVCQARLIFGTLYPAYYSYKAVKSKDIKEYVKWMMYWIIFALFTTAETFTDIFLCWFPFYYELKIAFVAWLLSPYTKGSSLLYRKFVHPTLSSKEKEIDDCLIQAKDRSYDALVHFGKRGLNVAATAAVMAASKGQGALSERLRSFSMQDLSTIRGDSSSTVPPSVTVRTSSKQSHPKPSRSASEGTGSSGTA
ncbi:Receptor expression-enhancing protein 1, partial [Lamprotornis superbus]